MTAPGQADEYTAPQEFLHVECDCVPQYGPPHCHLCDTLRLPIEWPCRYAEAMAEHDRAVREAAHKEIADRLDAAQQTDYDSRDESYEYTYWSEGSGQHQIYARTAGDFIRAAANQTGEQK